MAIVMVIIINQIRGIRAAKVNGVYVELKIVKTINAKNIFFRFKA